MPDTHGQTTVALTTLQFHRGGLFDPEPVDGYAIHLVRTDRGGGTPGPTLCGIDRFAKPGAGWSVGGGVYGPAATPTPCPGCAAVARRDFPGLPVRGSVGGREMAAALGVEYAPWGHIAQPVTPADRGFAETAVDEGIDAGRGGPDRAAGYVRAAVPGALLADVLAEALARLANVESLTYSTDGNPLAPGEEIPVGEVTRALHEPAEVFHA